MHSLTCATASSAWHTRATGASHCARALSHSCRAGSCATPLWCLATFGYTGFWHVTLYFFGMAERPFIQGRKYRVAKVLHNLAYSLSGVAIWVAFENVFAFLWGTSPLPAPTRPE